MATERMADVTDALRGNGFEFQSCDSSDGWFIFHGHLRTGQEQFRCELRVDPEFVQYPSVRLLQRPQGLPPVAPHMGSDYGICYIAKGTVVLDIFDPVGQTLACIERAGEVLGDIIAGRLRKDLEEEFYAYWLGSTCFVDLRGSRLGIHTTHLAIDGKNYYPVVTDDLEKTRAKLKFLGWKLEDLPIPTIRVRTKVRPRPSNQRWPIRTVQQLLEWQGLLDQNCRRKLLRRLEEVQNTSTLAVLLIIESPLMSYAGFVRFDSADLLQQGVKLVSRPLLFTLPVNPMRVMRLDARYAAQRNQPGRETLAAKRLVIIGCGTIGGYLADLLVKAGAGTGGGELVLIDFDVVTPANLGRHRLGFPSLFRNKAAALKQEFARTAPDAWVTHFECNVQQIELKEFDLLIDATGEESLGHWLAHRYKQSDMLTTWIEGPGVAVRGLLKPRVGGACFRCLCDANKAGQLRSVQNDVPLLLAGQGCEGLYVPFPATASVQAAALCAEMVSAWSNCDVAPRLRTRVLDATFKQSTPDCSPPSNRECPACGS